MIEVKDLVKRYGDHVAVDHLSFSVEEGQVYGFLGPNGAGKSTTMNIMTGYLAPTEGNVFINGHEISKEAEEAKKCIGYLPEQPPLYQDMTVWEYLMFAAELKKTDRKERKARVERMMEKVQILDMKDRLIRNLSKGYKQRVGLAQAMLGDPKIIILDEPTVGLDPKQIIEIRELIMELKKDHTVILSSHILSEVDAICDRIMIISGGKLVACDTPEGLQKLMSATAELELTVMGSMEELREICGSFPQVQEFKELHCPEEGCVKALLITASSDDIRRELSVRLNEKQIPIMSMNRAEKSLEDIFLTLTEKTVDITQEQNPEGSEEVDITQRQNPEDSEVVNITQEQNPEGSEKVDITQSTPSEAGKEARDDSNL